MLNDSAWGALDAVPHPLLVAHPIRSPQGNLTDFTLRWSNAQLKIEAPLWSCDGVLLSHVFPQLVVKTWLASIDTQRGTEATDRQIGVGSEASSQVGAVFQVDSRWLGDALVLSVSNLTAQPLRQQDALRASMALSQLMPELPSAYGVHIDEVWQRFPTAGFISSFGLTVEELGRFEALDLINETDRGRFSQWLETPVNSRTMPFIFRAKIPHGVSRWLELWMAQIPGSGSAPTQADFFLLRDIDTQILLQNANQEMLDRVDGQLDVMLSALNASRDGFAVWKAIRTGDDEIESYQLEFMNEAGAIATGKSPSELVGQRIEDVVGAEQYLGLFTLFSAALGEHRTQSKVVEIDSPQGWIGAYENQVIPFSKDEVVASFRDVSEDRREQVRLVWLAEHDHLTGMPNRRSLEHELETVLRHSRERKAFSAFVFIDIDDFKAVNDNHGHEVGDALLINFAKRIRSIVDSGAVVARIAGDEFAIVIDHVDSILAMTRLMEAIFANMRRPFNDELPPVSVTCSAGAVVTDGTQPISEVMRMADRAMYRAKHDGKNRFNVVSA